MNTSKASKTITLTGTQKPFLERSEILNMYYNDIREHKVLTQDETTALFELYQNGNEKEKEFAKNTIFEHNAKLVTSMARQYCTPNDNLMDLIQEGNIGLLNAIDKFDLTKESSFQKFALFYIRREINHFKVDYTPIVCQTNRSKTDSVVNTIISDFVQREHRNPTSEEVLEVYNQEHDNKKIVNKEDVINVEYVYIDNLDATDGEFSDSQGFLDYSSKSESFNDYIRQSNNDFNKEMISTLIEGLTPNEKKAISLFYGLDGGIESSLSMIGTVMNCTPERARQLCVSATNKMRKKSESLSYSI